MYNYTAFDKAFVAARAGQFRDQVQRRIDGSLTEAEFRPLRLMNGLYLLLHAYMLRVAIPYGTLDAAQMRALANISERFDKGYAHFTTRQNVQFHWPKLQDVPDILAALAEVDMHAVQTSGSCIRSVTADHFAGAAAVELADPRPTAEFVRQWSTDHPEFAFLPRKFKIAVSASPEDRAITRFHDIGLILAQNPQGAPGYEVWVGGGLGRTPMIGKPVRAFLPQADLLPYLEAILQVYNQIGRRDNKYKARIKITLHETGLEALRHQIEENFALQKLRFDGSDQDIFARIEADFTAPAYKQADPALLAAACEKDGFLRGFAKTNLHPHKNPDYTILTVSLKGNGPAPGDASAAQMRVLADCAETYGHNELRVSHEQNIILPHVHKADVPALYARLRAAGLGRANIGLITDLVACPGMDYCDLATARSTPIAQAIMARFKALQREQDIGDIKLKISGCINACGHHHVGHIGILGLEKAGVESFQITLGGDGSRNAAIGKTLGPGFAADQVLPAVERLLHAYLALRQDRDETFIASFRRLGPAPFKAALYETKGTKT